MIRSSSFSSSSSILADGSRTRTSSCTVTEILVCLLILLAPMIAANEATNNFLEAEIEGRNLVQQLLAQRQTGSFTNTGVLKIRDQNGKRAETSVIFKVQATPTNVIGTYVAKNFRGCGGSQMLSVTQGSTATNSYTLKTDLGGSVSCQNLAGVETMIPFANSDFWVADLGLEFFHWPAQKVLKHEMRRGQACKKLESTNPEPSINGYSRVVSWIDNDTGGIVQAEAFDAKGELLKEFAPKEFKKVNGQWQLQEMEIRNVQTGSRTRLEFNLVNR